MMHQRKSIPQDIKDRLMVEAMHRCCLCPQHEDITDLHHIVPISEEGPNEENNLMVVCPTCHAKIHRIRRMYTSEQLKMYKEKWIKVCAQGIPFEEMLKMSPGISIFSQNVTIIQPGGDEKINPPSPTEVSSDERKQPQKPPPKGKRKIKTKIIKIIEAILIGILIAVISGVILFLIQQRFEQQQVTPPKETKPVMSKPQRIIPPKETKPVATPPKISKRILQPVIGETPTATITVTATAPKKRVVVPPFKNSTGDNTRDHLGNWISNLITTRLQDVYVLHDIKLETEPPRTVVNGYPCFAIAQGYDKYNNPIPDLTYKWEIVNNYLGNVYVDDALSTSVKCNKVKEGIDPQDVEKYAGGSNSSARDFIIKFGIEKKGTITQNGYLIPYQDSQTTIDLKKLSLEELISLAIGKGSGMTFTPTKESISESDQDVSFFSITASDRDEKRFILVEGSLIKDRFEDIKKLNVDVAILGEYGLCEEGLYVTARFCDKDGIVIPTKPIEVKGKEKEIEEKIAEEVIKTISKLLSEGKI